MADEMRLCRGKGHCRMGKDHGDRDTVGQQADDIATSAAFEMIVRGAVGLTGVRRDGDAIVRMVVMYNAAMMLVRGCCRQRRRVVWPIGSGDPVEHEGKRDQSYAQSIHIIYAI